MGNCANNSDNEINQNELNVQRTTTNNDKDEEIRNIKAHNNLNNNIVDEKAVNPLKEDYEKYAAEIKAQFDQRIKDYGRVSNEEAMNNNTSSVVFEIESKFSDKIKEFECDFNSIDESVYFYKGVINFDNGTFYNGTWNYNSKKHGKGIFIKADGSKYQGEFVDDRIEGRGYYIDSKGNFYVGEFKNGQACGYGEILNHEIKDYHYKGQFFNDKMHGSGIETLPNGTIYEGQFNLGVKEPVGRISFPDGSFYVGDFSNSEINGKGKYTWNSGKVYEGDFLNNKSHGFGKTTWPDGSYYEGEYKNNQREGAGTHYIPDNKYYIGFWVNSLFHGKGKYVENGVEHKGIWRCGKKIKDLV